MKPFRYALATVAAICLVAPFARAQFVGGEPATSAPLTPEIKQKILDRANDLITHSAYVPGVDFSKWPEYLATQKDALDKAKTDDQFAIALQAALDKFKITHIVIHTPRAVNARLTNSTVGIGIRINIVPEGVYVVGLVEGAPAEKAGIEAGDTIVKANGVKVTGTGQIQGDEGTTVNLTVKKADGSMKDYTIVRKKFSTIRQEELTWDGKDTAILKIYTFDLSYDRNRVEDLIKQAAGAKRLIIDLRGNGGGAVLNLRHLLSTLEPDGTVMGTFVDKHLEEQFVTEHKGDSKDLKALAAWASPPNKILINVNKNVTYKGEIAVLVDGGSGSAAEIAAASLHESMGAPVVGAKSAGAVLVSLMRQLPDGYVLQLPIDDYLTSKGIRLEGNGVVPDTVVAKMPSYLKKGQIDPAWDAAIALLKKQEVAKAHGR